MTSMMASLDAMKQVQSGDRADNVPDVRFQRDADDAPADPGSYAASDVPAADAGTASD